MEGQTKTTTQLSRSRVKTLARVAALFNGTAPTGNDVVIDIFNDVADSEGWYEDEYGTQMQIPTLTDADIDAVLAEKWIQLDRIRALFKIDNCGY